MTGKNRRHYHCKALNSLLCADVPLRNYSLTHIGPRSKLPYWYSTAIIEFVVTRDELVYAICHVHCFSFFPFFSFMYLVYDFNNKYI